MLIAAPPCSSTSAFVSIIASREVFCANSLACSTQSFPVVASPTKMVWCGLLTRITFSSSSIKFLLLCRRPAVSMSTTSMFLAVAACTASYATAAASLP